jgi:hypothetical protein
MTLPHCGTTIRSSGRFALMVKQQQNTKLVSDARLSNAGAALFFAGQCDALFRRKSTRLAADHQLNHHRHILFVATVT